MKNETAAGRGGANFSADENFARERETFGRTADGGKIASEETAFKDARKRVSAEKITVKVIGGGLAGSEAAYYLARAGIPTLLADMKPKKLTPAHRESNFGELVCSNSLKSNDIYANACGLLKEEMRILGSLTMEAAAASAVPAGAALAVDREKFITFILHRDDGLRRRSEEKWHEDAILRIGRLKVEEHHFRPAQHLRGGAPRAAPVRSARSTFRR